jgi:hypothetical protein
MTMKGLFKHLIVGFGGAAVVTYVAASVTPYLGVAGAYAGLVAGGILITVVSWLVDKF